MTRVLAAGFFVWCGFVGSAVSAFGQGASGSALVVEEAREDYYNLGRAGLAGFRCEVRADSAAGLPAGAYFEAAVGARGGPRVALKFDGATGGDEAAGSARAAGAAAQKSLSGVLEEFSSLLFGSPLPPDRDYHVEDHGETLRVTFGSDEVRIIETMKKDRAIEEMIIATQHSTVTVRPEYQKLEKGFVPVAIDSKVEAAGADPVELRVDIAYQGVEGFELPQVVTVRDKELAAGAAVRFAFSGCQVAR
jgi:hypothetical protein